VTRRSTIARWGTAAIIALAALRPAAGQAQIGAAPPDSSAMPMDEVPAAIEAAGEDGVGDPEEELAHLASLRANPIDVNTAGVDELASVPGIGHVLAGAIVADRVRAGAFRSLADLRRVPLITTEALATMRPYVTVLDIASGARRRRPLHDLRISVMARIASRLEVAEGYRGADSARSYRGSPVRALTRLRVTSGRALVATLTMEKDPGEAFSDGRVGYDHVSGVVALSRGGALRRVVVGDFVADFGQGLALGRAGGMGKSADATRSPLRAGRGLRPFTSGGETSYLRGAGVTIAPLAFLELSGFASRRRLDATIDSVSGAATSVGGDGLHRTPAELARRGAVRESLAGGAAAVHLVGGRGDVRVGIAGYGAVLDAPLVPPARPDTRFLPAGRSTSVIAVHGDGRMGPFHAFAEVARAGESSAAVAGAGAAPGSGSEILVLARLYPAGFASAHGSGFAERSGGAGNERGLYVGARTAAPGGWTFAGYVDAYRFPWLRFNVPRPSSGSEALLRVDFEPRRWIRLHAQVRAESREAGAQSAGPAGAVVGALTRTTRRSRRLHVEFDASRSLRLRTRLESTVAVQGDIRHSGVLAFQDIRLALTRTIRLDARLALFEADDFSARLYQLENDVAGAFTLPALHGRGSRAYAMITVGPVAGLTLQGRLAATFLEDIVRQGSGADAVEGHRTRDVTLQVRWQF
jgi:hypothetical protein